VGKPAYGRRERARAKVPATSANLGPGFDALGIALSMYAWIELAPSEVTQVTLLGPQMNGLPTDKSNLLYTMAQRVFDVAGAAVPELDIRVYSDIPLTRGLGSSAAAIVGALGAANALIGCPLPDEELFRLATAEEGHPDNVGPALFGGIVSAVWDGAQAMHIRIEPPKGLTALVAIPSYELSTNKARAALPDQISRADAVFNLSRASLLTAALATGRLDVIRHAMDDRIHQPYRAPLVPGLARVLREATSYGALGAALSGAGPTAIAFVDDASNRKAELEAFLREAMSGEDGRTKVDTLWLTPATTGLTLVTADQPLEAVHIGGLR
jgi:homoserine kinase